LFGGGDPEYKLFWPRNEGDFALREHARPIEVSLSLEHISTA